MTLAFYPGQSLDIHVGCYYNLIMCILMIYIGCFTAFAAASKIKYYPKWLCYIGQNTLVIYIYHGYVLEIFKRIFNRLNVDFQNWAFAILITITTVAVCCLIVGLLTCYCLNCSEKEESINSRHYGSFNFHYLHPSAARAALFRSRSSLKSRLCRKFCHTYSA